MSMLKNFYMLVIVSCCLFLISCRANKTEDFEEAVVQGQPYYMLYQSTPYVWHYQYGWQGPISTDWAFYEEQLMLLEKSYEVKTDLLETKIESLQVENEQLRDEDKEFRQLLVATDEQHEIRANLLKDKIERLQIENQELKAELVQRKTWPDFWQELKTTDEKMFENVEKTLAEFVGQYLYPACYITVADLKAMMREITVHGEIKTKTYFGEQNNVEEENQKIEEVKESNQANKSQSGQEEKHCCEESVWHDGEKQKRLRTQKQMKN